MAEDYYDDEDVKKPKKSKKKTSKNSEGSETGKKRKTELKGFLMVEDVSKADKSNTTLQEYWKRVKDNLFILGDDNNVVFLNNELKKIAQKYEGRYIKITFEETPYIPPEEEGLMDIDTEYKGFEKAKRTFFKLFKIS